MSDDLLWLASLRGRKAAARHLGMVLTRKERNNGHARHLLRRATFSNQPVEYRRGVIRLLIKRLNIAGIFLYDIACVEGREDVAKLLAGWLREDDREKKVPLGERSKLRWCEPAVEMSHAVPQTARLKRHLRNTWLTWDLVVRAIAEATHTDLRKMANRLSTRMTDGLIRGERYISLAHHLEFRFHIELVGDGKPSENPNIEVRVYTTNNNKDPVYRLFRARLKRLCGLQKKSDREAQVIRLARRNWREQQRRLAA